MRTLLIVWHSRTGGARQMAQAAYDGAASAEDIAVRSLPATTASAEDLCAADGFIFAAPENLAALSGPMKDFFDRLYYPVLGRIEGRPFATLVCAGSDGEGAVRQIARIATGWRLRQIAEPIIVRTQAQTPEAILADKHLGESDLARCRELGAAFGTGLALGVF
jgi:multimeric flavodoxin WrbA